MSVVHLGEREKRVATAYAETGGAGDRTYRYQWIVQAHTRQQWYPSLGTHLPILIGPYIKGPRGQAAKASHDAYLSSGPMTGSAMSPKPATNWDLAAQAAIPNPEQSCRGMAQPRR